MPKDEEIRQLLRDQGLSDWFKRSLLSALDRDPGVEQAVVSPATN